MIPHTLFIPLGNGSTWNNNELRYALRSWEMYADIKLVYICGEVPHWMQNVVQIPYQLTPRFNKPAEIMAKTKLCQAEQFIFSNDDIFLLRELTDLPNYAQGLMKDFKGGSATYMRYVAMTAINFPQAPNFDIHAPMVMHRNVLARMDYKTDVLFKTYYAVKVGLIPTEHKDLKIDRQAAIWDHEAQLQGQPFFSIGDNCGWPLRKWIEQRYPNKSRWEM